MKRMLLVLMGMVAMLGAAQPVKSIVGARGIGATETGWTNPYITEGLVAMWDGEWNAGGGVHDASASVWQNLMGDDVATPRTSDFTWGTNKCSTQSGCTFATSIGTGMTAATVQVVILYAGRNHSSAAVVGSFGNTINSEGSSGYGGITLGMGAYNVNVYGYAACPWSYISFYAVSQGYSYTDINSLSLTWGGANLPVALYINDFLGGTVNESTLGVNKQNFSIGSTHTSGGENMWGDFYCVRIYNRALTAEEIAHNYAIDKERFGLP